MAYDNSGSLGKNKYRKTNDQPEYTGTATIGGVKYKIAAWVNEGKETCPVVGDNCSKEQLIPHTIYG